jgi:hypothetical protein
VGAGPAGQRRAALIPPRSPSLHISASHPSCPEHRASSQPACAPLASFVHSSIHPFFHSCFFYLLPCSFTPHLMPMTRGMESSCYVKMAPGVTVADLRKCLEVGWAGGRAGWLDWLGLLAGWLSGSWARDAARYAGGHWHLIEHLAVPSGGRRAVRALSVCVAAWPLCVPPCRSGTRTRRLCTCWHLASSRRHAWGCGSTSNLRLPSDASG